MTDYISRLFARFHEIFHVNEGISSSDSVAEILEESPPPSEEAHPLPHGQPTDSSGSSLSTNRRHKHGALYNFFHNKRLLITAIIFSILLGLVIPIGILSLIVNYVEPEQYTCSVDAKQRIPCIVGGINASQDTCYKVGCCYDSLTQTVNGVQAPYCFHSNPSQHDYSISDIKGDVDLMQIQFDLKPRSDSLKAMNESTLNARFFLNVINSGYVRIRGTINDSRYNQNVTLLWEDMPPGDVSDPVYSVVHSKKDEPFTLAIVRQADNVTIVALTGGPLSMTTNYVEYNIKTPSTNVYGLGEGVHRALKHSMDFETWRLFGRSGLTTSNGRTYYGVHPFYLCIEDSGAAHGVLLGLSQPSEVALQPGPSISFRTSGGLVELHVFAGPTPKDVIRQLTALVGRPFFPPYWALGYHTCRASGNVKLSKVVIPGMVNANIPHESDCGDALMLKTMGLPTNEKVLTDLASVSSALASSDRKFVLYQGPQVKNGTSTTKTQNPPFDDGTSEHVFINKTKSSLYVGQMDRTTVVYPDMFGPNTNSWMIQQFTGMHQAFESHGIRYDGMFLVDNTPLDSTNKTKSPCPSESKLPPVSKYIINYYKEANDTVCLSALELDGNLHYARHNMYGYNHVRAVSNAINATTDTGSDRVLLSSMSTFSGCGRYSGHWGGEYETSWAAMNASIVQLLEFGLYGMPLTGASICGYRGSIPNEDLCWRWMQVGAFYPLALTYYGHGERPREPIFFEKSYQTMARDVLNLRYSLLPYFYTQFANAHLYGDPVVRPMFYEFPEDPKVRSTKNQFMWGSGLLVVPTLDPNYAVGYFPHGYWYEYVTHRCINSSRNGTYHSLVTSRHLPNIYIRGGSVIVTQEPSVTTVESRMNNYTVLVALDQDAANDSLSSSGEVYIDDGWSPDSPVLQVRFQVTNNTYESYAIRYDDAFDLLTNISCTVSYVSIMGIPSEPKEVYVNFNDPNAGSFHYNSQARSMLLDVQEHNYDLRDNFTISWILD